MERTGERFKDQGRGTGHRWEEMKSMEGNKDLE